MTVVDHVNARFGGKDRTFRIARADLTAFELAAKSPAYALFRKFVGGNWTMAETLTVLRFANLGPQDMAFRRQMTPLGLGQDLADDDAIDAVLTSNPPAQYAMLAQAILGAALFGLDEAEAVFSDEATSHG